MEYRTKGKILQGVGGLYTICLTPNDTETPLGGQTVFCRAKGAFRHAGLSPLPGDDVVIRYDDSSFSLAPDGSAVPSESATGIRIEDILPRRCTLIRPPMSNLDILFVTMAAAQPAPILTTVDKLISIAEFNHIEPILLITKADLDPENAGCLTALYRKAGFDTYAVSCETGEGIDALSEAVRTRLPGKIAAFGGASGVGKSTLLNRLFPLLSRQTGSISQKNERGKHTTREVSLAPLSSLVPSDTYRGEEGYVADTPGFSQLDFVHFDFFGKEDLPLTMREFLPYFGQCRWADCSHTKEDGCAIRDALARGDILPSRYESFLAMYGDLKDKRPWIRPGAGADE